MYQHFFHLKVPSHFHLLLFYLVENALYFFVSFSVSPVTLFCPHNYICYNPIVFVFTSFPFKVYLNPSLAVCRSSYWTSKFSPLSIMIHKNSIKYDRLGMYLPNGKLLCFVNDTFLIYNFHCDLHVVTSMLN